MMDDQISAVKMKGHLSNEKDPGWLFDIGDYTTQLY